MSTLVTTIMLFLSFSMLVFPFIIWGIRNMLRLFRGMENESLRTFLIFSWHLIIPGTIIMTLSLLSDLGSI